MEKWISDNGYKWKWVASSHKFAGHGAETEMIQGMESRQTGVYFLKVIRDGKEAGITKLLKQ